MADEGWGKVQISELIRRGALLIDDGYRVRNVELGPTGTPFVRGGDIGDGFITTKVSDHIRPEFAERIQKKLAQPFDVAFISKGTVGRVGLLRPGQPKVVFAPQVCYWRSLDRKQLNPRFLFYSLTSQEFQTNLNAVKTHGSMVADYVSLSDQRAFSLTVPPIEAQDAIAQILGTLDDKIELNRSRNRTLEALAQAIFQSWFVDFEPVRAKAAGRMPPGLKPEFAAAFPDAFEHSELGEIPKGWRVASLGDHIIASKGLSYKGQHLCEPGAGLPMHNLNSVYEGGGYKHEGLKWYNGEYRPVHLLKPGDVIVTNTEQGFDYLLIGFAAIVPKRYGSNGLFSHHIYRIQPRATSYLPAWFSHLLLRTKRFHEVVAGHSNGTTVNMLPIDGLQKPRFVLPPKNIVECFDTLFIPSQQQLECTHDENLTLAAVRDALLPKLISGELRVPDAERVVRRCNL